jgi:hypothetical protein
MNQVKTLFPLGASSEAIDSFVKGHLCGAIRQYKSIEGESFTAAYNCCEVVELVNRVIKFYEGIDNE